ncbi:MAG: hypothetical protein J6X81_06050 [Muribaculaceae bacterium]|nr:hypothetical protein [Muribaculaceae bacterium]
MRHLRSTYMPVLIAVACLLSGCFTGVENTKKITEKDVRKAESQISATESSLPPYSDSVPVWQEGKKFYVTDNQVKLIFSSSPSFNIDTLSLAGKILTFTGYNTGSVLDNRQTVNLHFSDGVNTFVYPSGKTMQDFSHTWNIPFLVNCDEVEHYARLLTGKDAYIKTSIWYSPQSETMRNGRKFIKVHIDSIVPGNKVFPLKVIFTPADKSDTAMVWMATSNTVMQGRDFDSMFSMTDIRLQFPSISNANWQHIVNGEVVKGMTKDECRLALGVPRQTNNVPTYDGVLEHWYYDGGAYLIFMDGSLLDFRR